MAVSASPPTSSLHKTNKMCSVERHTFWQDSPTDLKYAWGGILGCSKKKGHDSQNCNEDTSSAICTQILTIKRAVSVSCSHSGKETILSYHNCSRWQWEHHESQRTRQHTIGSIEPRPRTCARGLPFFFCLNIFLLARSWDSSMVNAMKKSSVREQVAAENSVPATPFL